MIIDMGPEVIDRSSVIGALKTLIVLDNPANAAGIITDVEVWSQTTIAGFIIAVFSGGGGAGEYTARSSALLGDVVAGSKSTFSGLSLAVEAGDYLGCYFPSGKMEADVAGNAGLLSFSGDGTESTETYTLAEGDTISIGASGTDAGEPTYPSGNIASMYY